jgi:cell division protein FtsZ
MHEETESEPELEPVLEVAQVQADPVLKIVDPAVEAFEAGSREPEFELVADPAPLAARAAPEEEALVIPQRRQDQQAQQRGWRLSLFGSRRPEPVPDEPPMPQFRNSNAVTAAKSMSSAQVVEEAEPEDDLEIPSFLRRLAN